MKSALPNIIVTGASGIVGKSFLDVAKENFKIFAIPYIHSSCICQILITIFMKSERLPPFDIYIAGPDGSTSHRELFESATRYFFGRRIKSLFIPKSIATTGVVVRYILGHIIGIMPFERYWMMKYTDKALNIESSYTRKEIFSHYQSSETEKLEWDISVFYQLLTASVRNHDRFLLLNYYKDILVPIRFREGFESHEVCNAILESGRIIISLLVKNPDLKGMEQVIHDNIAMTIQLAVDEVENAFEKLAEKPSIAHIPHRADVEQKLQDLATFYITEK